MNADDRALINQLIHINSTVAEKLSENQNLMAHLAPGLDKASSQIIGAINAAAEDTAGQMKALKLHLSSDLKELHQQANRIQDERREWWYKDSERLESQAGATRISILLYVQIVRGVFELGIFGALCWIIAGMNF